MHNDNSKQKRLQQCMKVKRSFYSLCRNYKGINLDNSDDSNIIIETFKEKYNELDINDYILLLSRLNKMILQKDVTPNDAIIIAINVVDPNYKLYSLSDKIDNVKELKREIMKIYHFYDDAFLDVEKRYVEGNNLHNQKTKKYKKEV